MREETRVREPVRDADVQEWSETVDWAVKVVKPVDAEATGAERPGLRHGNGECGGDRVIDDAIVEGEAKIPVGIAEIAPAPARIRL